MQTRKIAGLLAGLVLAGCAVEPPQPRPAFYQDLASGGTLDSASALSLVNDYRRANGLGVLTWDAGLAAEAENEARRHAAADGLLTAGIRDKSSAADSAIRRSVSGGYHTMADAFSGWRGSPAHDAVLRDPKGAAIGIGAVARAGSRHRVYWVVLVRRR